MTDNPARGSEHEVGKVSDSPDSNSVAHKKRYLPLLTDVPQQHQIKLDCTGASNLLPGSKAPNKERHDLWTRGNAKGFTFLPLLPDVGKDCVRHGVQDHGPNAGSGSPRSPSEGALKTERPSHEHRDPVAEAATQDNNVRQNRSKARRRYEWPLIINGVYQGKGPLPSCRIEDNESPTEPQPYAWPLIVLHRARSVEDCDQQPGPNGKVANEDTAQGEEKDEGVRKDEKRVDEPRTTDGISAER